MIHWTKYLQLYSVFVASIIITFPLIVHTQNIFDVPAYPYETCIVDYDLDGDNDILVGCNLSYDNDTIVFFINDGWGNFDKHQIAANGALFFYCADLTNDEYPDIITRDGDSIFFYENDQLNGIGSSHYINHVIGNPRIGGIEDMDMDGDNDIVYYDITIPYRFGILFNDGDGSFTDSAFVEFNETWRRLDVGDLDNDAIPDILVSTYDNSDKVYILYNRYPNFTRYDLVSPDWNPGIILNLNGDDWNDITLYRSFFGTGYQLNLENEQSQFSSCNSTIYEDGPRIMNYVDYNLDGYDDMATTIYRTNWEDSVYIYFNDQNCGFTEVQGFYVGTYVFLPTANNGDLNGDGYPELVVQGFDSPRESIVVMWNDGTGHFIDTNSVYVYQKEIGFVEYVNIYPNPTQSTVCIDFSIELKNHQSSIEILNIHGLTKLKFSTVLSSNKIDISKFEPGVYIIKIKSGQKTTVKRIIKQ